MPGLAAQSYAIPGRLNLHLLAAASAASAALLYLASRADSLLGLAACAVAFSFTANTLFSLLHESVHGIFSPDRRINEWAGRLAAAWFPTGLALQRAYHLTHHRNNRSRLEQFDVLHDGDVLWLKYAQWYAILTGIYWAVAVLGTLVYLIAPGAFRAPLLRDADSQVAEQTSSRAYFAALDELDPWRARLEILLSIALQAAMFWALELTPAGWLACYAAFALSWSSLQYVDHAFSPLDNREGAWNLRVGPIGRSFFLNYHSHLAHHRHSQVPWIHLDSLIVPGEPRPRFFRVLLEAWRGPRRPGRFPSFAGSTGDTAAFLAVPRGFDGRVAAVLTLLFTLVFLLLFAGANAIADRIPWRIEVTLPGELGVPFVPAAAVLYLSLNAMLGLAPFVLRAWRELVPLFATLVAETAVAALFFVALPVRNTFPERQADGVIGALFTLADTLNLEHNYFPSLHVAFAVTAALAYARKAGPGGRALLWGWATAIVGSTLLIHEHHLLDIAGGIVLALCVWRTVGSWAGSPGVLQALDVELLCLRNLALFGRRHRRYWLVALGLLRDSLPRWRATRVLRTGFCFLQLVDDLLDGDRPCARDPLAVVDDLARALQDGRFADDDAMRLARAFSADLRAAGGARAVAMALALIEVMKRDRRRARERAIWSERELREQHRATFDLSIDLMLVARNAALRAADVPELIDALGWCSTMRDLREDLQAGLINIPGTVVDAARAEGLEAMEFEALVRTPAVRGWIRSERDRATGLLDAADRRIRALGAQPGRAALRTFARSIRSFWRHRLPRLYPFLDGPT